MRTRTAGGLISSFAFAGLMVSFPTSAFACTAANFESHVTRDRPVATVPAGAIQLQIDVPYNEDELRLLRRGQVTLPVKNVLHGSYEDNSIDIDFINYTSCDYFGPTGQNLYIVVYPLLYDEGDPVKNNNGKDLVDVIRYNSNIDPLFQGKLEPSRDGPVDILKERKIFSCVRRGKETEEAFTKCVDAENPDNLYKQGNAGAYWLAAGFLTFSVVAQAMKLKQ
jgi:hypothetical protein